MFTLNAVLDCVAIRRAGKLCLAAALLAIYFTSGVGAAPEPETPTAVPSATRRFSLPFTFSKPAGPTTAPSTEPATGPATGPGFSLPFDFSGSKAMEATKLPTPSVAQVPPATATSPAAVQQPVAATIPDENKRAAYDAFIAAMKGLAGKSATEGERNRMAAAEGSGFGRTPRPTPQVREYFNNFIQDIADPENTLDLVVGKPRILRMKQAPVKVQIPGELIATYDIMSEKEMSVMGVAVGTTTLNIWFDDKSQPDGRALLSYYVRVMADPETRIRIDKVYEALERELNKAFPNSLVHLKLVGRNLIVTGEAKDANEADKIIQVLTSNLVGNREIPTATPGFVGNAPAANTGAPNAAPEAPAAANAPTTSGETLGIAQNGVGGNADGARNPSRRGGTAGNSFVINMLRVPGEHQVMLRVTVAEVNRDAARSIGLNFTVSNHAGPIFANLTGGLGKFASGAQGSQFPMLIDNGQLSVTLEALRSISLAKSLAEPNLVASNGQNASFLAGGKFPVPVVTGATSSGLEGVQYIPFGISLNFTPFITDKDIIRLVLDAEVSTRDATTGTQIGSGNAAGLNTRNISTTVDLQPGQTLAVAGLVQTNYGSGSNRIPFFGEMPLLANLLGQSQSSTSEQELVILINADIVRAMDPKEVPPLPGHDMFEANDVEFFLDGRLESKHGPDWRSATRTDFERLTRYQRLQRSYLFGAAGYSDGRTGEEAPGARKPAGITPANNP